MGLGTFDGSDSEDYNNDELENGKAQYIIKCKYFLNRN